jgi:SSS family solute:Na+ symporter
MSLEFFDFVVIGLYLAGVIGLSLWFARTNDTASEFMVASGSVPWWAVGLSIFGTFLSSNTFIAYPGKAYASNWNALAFSLSLPIAAAIAARYFVPFYRQAGGISAYEHLEERFGSWARVYGVVCYLLTQIVRMGAMFVAIALVLAQLTGWPQITIILVAGVLITFYTTIGGIEAVIWTDVAQAIVLGIGAVGLLVLLLVGMPEGPGQAVEIAWANDKFSLGDFGTSLVAATFWVTLSYGVFENLRNFGIDQNYVQRYHAARTQHDAARSLWLGMLLYVPVSVLFFMIGSALFAYYQVHPDSLAAVQSDVARTQLASEREPTTPEAVATRAASLTPADIGDRVLPHFIATRLPAGIRGLLIAAIFAAAMSSIDTSLNSSATVILIDIYKRLFRPHCSNRESMIVLYTATALMGAVAMSVAIALIGVQSVLDAYWTLSSILAGGLLGLFLLGMISRHAERPAAVAGVVAGIAVVLWMTLPKLTQFGLPAIPTVLQVPLHATLTLVVGTMTVLMVGMVVARWRSKV